MDPDVDAAGGFGLHLVLRAARRRWPLVLAGLLVGAVAGAGIAKVLPHKFSASAQVLVRPVAADTAAGGTRPTGAVTMATEAQVARSEVVRALAAKKVAAAAEPGPLQGKLQVTVLPETLVLQFNVTGSTPRAVKREAQAYAAAYLDNREATAQQFVDEQQRALAAQLSSLERQIDVARAKVAQLTPGTTAYSDANARAVRLEERRGQAETDLSTIRSSPVAPGQIIQDAATAQRTGLTPQVVLLAVALLGLLLGVGLATLRERTDPRLLEPGDFEDELGVPLLTVLPPSDGGVLLDPDSATADAYRQLRNEIFLSPNPPVVLAVTRTDAELGTGDVTANLAVLLARSGRRVCVIDTDNSSGRLDELLDGVDRIGLVHAAPSADGTFDPGIVVVSQREGIGQAELGDLLASPLFAGLVDATRQKVEVVLIDAPPALTSAGQAVLSTADGVLLVVTRRNTRRGDVREAQDRVRRTGTRLVGTALRDTEARRGAATAPVRPDEDRGRTPLPPRGRPALPAGSPLAGNVHTVPAEGTTGSTTFPPAAPGGPWVARTVSDPPPPAEPAHADPVHTVDAEILDGDTWPAQPTETPSVYRPTTAPDREPVPAPVPEPTGLFPEDGPSAGLGWPPADNGQPHSVDEEPSGQPAPLGWPEYRRALP